MPKRIERRQFGRRQTNQSAVIFVAGRPSLHCNVRNISPKGALLELDEAQWLPFNFKIQVSGDPALRDCEVKHTIAKSVGVLFIAPPAPSDGLPVADRLLVADEWLGSSRKAASRSPADEKGRRGR